MFLTLTNSAPSHKGIKISINSDYILSIHRNIATRQDGTIEDVTYIHCPPNGTWEVEESLEEINEMLNSGKTGAAGNKPLKREQKQQLPPTFESQKGTLPSFKKID